MIKKQKVHTKKGISLVISLIMMALLLSLSFSISNIILRQIRLTNTSSNSQNSFYAADSALECAVYMDTISDGTVAGDFATAYFGTTTPWGGGPNPIKCGIDTGSAPMGFTKVVSSDQTIATTTFAINYGVNSCANVEVVKSEFRTKISASGYNVGPNVALNGCDLTDAIAKRVVERGLVFTH